MVVEFETSDYFRDFDWGNLKAFYYVAKVGNISTAANFLQLSQPAMSRQITKLEKHLGYPLFTRNRGGVKLTRKGEELLSKVAPFFLEIKEFCGNNHATTKSRGKRKIRIATTHAIASYIINGPILEYNKNHPDLIFELLGDDHILDVVINDVDIAIRPYEEHAQGVIQDPLFTLEKKLYASREYLEKYGEPKTVDDLKNHHLITTSLDNPEGYPYSDIHWILKLGMPEGKLHEPVFTSSSIECRIEAAKRGIGIISNYEKMSILRDANLKNILPTVSNKKLKEYFIYPDYLKEDIQIIDIKNYLQQILLCEDN